MSGKHRADSTPPPEASVNRSVVWLGLAVAFSLFGDMAIYAILPVYYVRLGLTPLQVGIILSANRWVRVFTNHLARDLLSRFSPAILLSLALATGSLIAFTYSLRPGFTLLLLARVVWGLCWSFIRHTGVMTSIGTTRENAVGRVFGLYQGLVQLGFIAGTLSGSILFGLFGYRMTFVAMSAVSLISLPAGAAGFGPLGGRAAPPLPRDREGERPRISLLLRGFIVSCVGTGLIMSTLGHTLEMQLGQEVSFGTFSVGIVAINGVLLSLRYGINSVGSPFLGALLDRFGLRRGEALCAVGASAALLIAGVLRAPAAMVASVVLFFVLTTVVRIAVESQAGLRGQRSYAMTATAIDLGAAAGPVLGWIGIQYLNRPSATFLTGGVLFIAAAVLASVGRHSGGSRSVRSTPG